ncbi:MAG: Sb-PDE family phosphodiesterase [Planctomycetota bacterium]
MTRVNRMSWMCGIVGLLLSLATVRGQEIRHEIQFPDLPGYKTMKCDLHMHTVFSDGDVWPTVRVDEAWRQGLDVISITDHIEYQPHDDDIPTNHNRPYELAKGTARSHNLMFIRGAEITRDTPPGHFNAVFLQDADKLDTPDFLDAIEAANQQDAFVFWNHQGWKGEERGRWMDVHATMFEDEMFQGMEVCNGETYYPTAHRWCVEKDLTMLGTSDIHPPDLLRKSTASEHRTMTLVFAKERTPESLKEALLDGRTVVWFKDQLIGRRDYLESLFHEVVTVKQPIVRTGKNVWLQIANSCHADVNLARAGGNGPESMTVPAGATALVRFSTADSDTPLDLRYTVTNWLIKPETGLPVELRSGQDH